MKKLLTIICAIIPGVIMAQSFSEKITKELQFEKKTAATLMILNINGSVKVEAYAGDKVIVEVNKQVNAKTEARLERGKNEVALGIIDRADTIILYVKGVCEDFGKELSRYNGNRNKRYGGWGYQWRNQCGDNNKEYDWELDFIVKVPQGINVLASTVNNGDVEVRNTTAFSSAENINGSIRMENISGTGTYASTINGDVDVDYSKNPNGECRYYSLNGDVNVLFVKGLAADVAFESFNGDLFTNVTNLETLPAEMKKSDKGKGLSYKLGGSRFKIGPGGPFLDFETFNGNAYIKEK